MEAGKRDISGPVQVAIEAVLSGWRPSGWVDLDGSDDPLPTSLITDEQAQASCLRRPRF